MERRVGKVYVVFQLDTEDFITPETDDVLLDLARLFDKYGVKATFAVVGEKARVLKRRGRWDVIEALKRHDIAYQSNYHSLHPTLAEQLRDSGWDEGVEIVIEREGPGLRDLEEIFGQFPSAYIQPGGDWAPQVAYAMGRLGVPVYADGIFEPQPFWFCGVLAVRYALYFDERKGPEPGYLDGLKAQFEELYRSLLDRCGVIVVVLHPCMLRAEEFWDLVNFARGTMPEEVKPAPLCSEETYRARLRAFEEFVSFVVGHERVKVITYRELPSFYEGPEVELTAGDLRTLAERLQERLSYHVVNGKPVSLADAFSALSYSLKSFLEKGVLPPSVKPLLALGPLQRPPRLEKSFYASLKDVAEAAAKAYSDIAACGAIPAEISVSGRRVGPLSFLRAMAQAYRQLLDGSTESIEIHAMNEEPAIPGIDFTSRVAGNWKWVIFPEEFNSQRILEQTLLQLWTLKPAVIKFQQAAMDGG